MNWRLSLQHCSEWGFAYEPCDWLVTIILIESVSLKVYPWPWTVAMGLREVECNLIIHILEKLHIVTIICIICICISLQFSEKLWAMRQKCYLKGSSFHKRASHTHIQLQTRRKKMIKSWNVLMLGSRSLFHLLCECATLFFSSTFAPPRQFMCVFASFFPPIWKGLAKAHTVL